MKFRTRILIALAIAMIDPSAHAAFTGTDNAYTAKPTEWQKVVTTVKTWWSRWNQPQTRTPASIAQQSPAIKTLKSEPLFQTEKKGSTLKDVESARQTVESDNLVKVTQPARHGTSHMMHTKAGIPLANWARYKVTRRIPRLDIGTEESVSRQDFEIPNLSWFVQKPSDLQPLPQPQDVSDAALAQLVSMKIEPAKTPDLKEGLHINRAVTEEDVNKVQYKIDEGKPIQELAYKPLTPDQTKLLAALILYKQGGQCPMVIGLFHELSKKADTQDEASYYVGACAHKLKMHDAAFHYLSQVIDGSDSDYRVQALTLLAEDLPIVYERDFYQVVRRAKTLLGSIGVSERDDVFYRYAKGAYRNGQFQESLEYTAKVSPHYKYFDDDRLLSAMDSFALHQKTEALNKLEALWQDVRDSGDSNTRALVTVNLARMYFAQRQFGKALNAYMQVPKDHPLWVEALIEQGWTQLAIGDYAGAIGNMYSLHSPYFKAVYQPESFVVRTIGYLNICQYGDAYRTLTWLEKDYRDWGNRLNQYLAANNKSSQLYGNVLNYIRGKSTNNLDGVPYQIWREMAHQKRFLNLQTALNDNVDEVNRYGTVVPKIVAAKSNLRWRAQKSKARFSHWRAELAQMTKNHMLEEHRQQWYANAMFEKDLTIGLRFHLAMLEVSRQDFIKFKTESDQRLASEDQKLSSRAGETLLRRAFEIKREIARVLDINEFLRYEVFAGSGENIRYQVEGGKVGGPDRIPAYIKPTKMMNWDFDGEYWADEIGSYRSSLHNNCPSVGQRVHIGAKKGES